MDPNVAQDERTDYDITEQDPGSTMILTESGWEAADYIDPGDDWGLMPDGSYLSPDGVIRTFPHGGVIS